MKLIIKTTIIGFVLVSLMACKEKTIALDYCKMIAEDQSYVNTNPSDSINFKADKAKRGKIFEKNFALVINKTKQEGFPYINLKNPQEDSCKYWAVSMTMIHMAQSKPAVFFSKKYVNLFKHELDKGNIEKKLLQRASLITARTIDLCEELKPQIEYASKQWAMDIDLFKQANFINCE